MFEVTTAFVLGRGWAGKRTVRAGTVDGVKAIVMGIYRCREEETGGDKLLYEKHMHTKTSLISA